VARRAFRLRLRLEEAVSAPAEALLLVEDSVLVEAHPSLPVEVSVPVAEVLDPVVDLVLAEVLDLVVDLVPADLVLVVVLEEASAEVPVVAQAVVAHPALLLSSPNRKPF